MTLASAIAFALKHRDKAMYALIIALLIMLYGMNSKISTLKIALSAKPRVITKVETKVETKIQTRVVQGPERVVEKIIIKPSGERVVERVVYKDRIITIRGTKKVEESKDEASQDPVVALEAVKGNRPRWIVGASVAPMLDGLSKGTIVRAGYSFGGRLDLTYGHAFDGPAKARHRAGVAIRF